MLSLLRQLLFNWQFKSSGTYCPLPTAHCLLLTAHCLLPSSFTYSTHKLINICHLYFNAEIEFVLLNFKAFQTINLNIAVMKNSRRRFIQQTTMAGAGILAAKAGFSFTAQSYRRIIGANDRVRGWGSWFF